MKLRYLSEAFDEYMDSISYYERVQPDLGDAVFQRIEEALSLTVRFPEIGAIQEIMPSGTTVRMRRVERFNIELVYAVFVDELVVIAIFHAKRRPGYWRSRLAHVS